MPSFIPPQNAWLNKKPAVCFGTLFFLVMVAKKIIKSLKILRIEWHGIIFIEKKGRTQWRTIKWHCKNITNKVFYFSIYLLADEEKSHIL